MLESVKRQAGLSIIELLVGLAIGLFVVASSVTLVVNHLREHRSAQLEARLTQDLRSAADLIARDLRRAGYWGDAGAGIGSPAQPARVNPYLALVPDAAASDAIGFAYSCDAIENHALDGNEQFGYRLRSKAIELQLGSGNWQALTDATLLTISAFSVTPSIEEIDLGALCSQPCPVGSASCPPRLQVRRLAVQIAGRSVADASIARSVQVLVRLRNDMPAGACPA